MLYSTKRQAQTACNKLNKESNGQALWIVEDAVNDQWTITNLFDMTNYTAVKGY